MLMDRIQKVLKGATKYTPSWQSVIMGCEITSGFIYPQKGLGQFWPLEPSSNRRFVVPSLSSKCLASVSNDLAYYSGEEAEDTPLSPKH